MFAILYLILAFFVGWVVRQLFKIDTPDLFYRISGRTRHLPPVWTFDFPFSLIVGVTLVTTVHYYLSFLFSLILPGDINPLLASNIAFVPFLSVFFCLSFKKIKKNANHPAGSDYFSKMDFFYWKTLFFFSCFSIFLIFYSFFVFNGYLNSGATVFSDFAPHTAIIRSFSKGMNFPTQYPHFANDGIQYHFLFFYLCGNLEYLGLRIDFAMNIPSILGILSFTTLLGCLGVLLTKRRWVFFLAPFMLFFRSSYAIFSYLRELTAKNGATLGSVFMDILKTNKFIGQTTHDDWGLWSLNVYANQRHFLWGFSILLLVLFLFIPSIRIPRFHKYKKEKPGLEKIAQYLVHPSLWKIQNGRELLLCLLLIACLPYWHGSVLIALLCILFVMVFFSKNRLSFILAAGVAVVSALLQAWFFSGGARNVASPTLLWGFLSSDTSIPGVLSYLFQVLGISFLLIFFLPFIQKNFKNRTLILACLSPLVFALCISLTPDVTVNHKYIIITMALLNIFIADAFCTILQFTKDHFEALRTKSLPSSDPSPNRHSTVRTLLKKALFSALSVILVLLLSFSLFATGIPELTGYFNKNMATVKIDLNSPLTEWIEKNTDPSDVFLTAPYHMNEFFFSGRKAFYGWSYFSWSAGHDTASRKIIVESMFLGYEGDLEAFLKNVKQEKIRYAIIDDTLLMQSEYDVDPLFFKMNFAEVARFPAIRNTIIYQLY